MNTKAKKIMKGGILAIFFLFIISYAFFTSRDLLFGVKIRNVNLTDGATFSERVTEVSGKAKNAIHLSLNGRPIFIDQRGNFDETIALLPGYNIINIRAEDKFGNIDEHNYQIMLKNQL